jgi:hypothetical protein
MLFKTKEPNQRESNRRHREEYDRLFAAYCEANVIAKAARDKIERYRAGDIPENVTDEVIATGEREAIRLSRNACTAAAALVGFSEKHGDAAKLDRDLTALDDAEERKQQGDLASALEADCRELLAASDRVAQIQRRITERMYEARTRWRQPTRRGSEVTVPAADDWLPSALGYPEGCWSAPDGAGTYASLLGAMKLSLARWRPSLFDERDPVLERAAESKRLGLNQGLVAYLSR